MERVPHFDRNLWWIYYKPANINICHDLLAIKVAGQVGQSLQVSINAEGVFRNILQVLVSDVFNEDVAQYVEEEFLIFLGGLAGRPRLFVNSVDGTTTAKVAKAVELLLEAYKKAMGQRTDVCKGEGGGDSKDKEGGDLLLINMPLSGSISFKKKHWLQNQDLLGLNLFGLKEKVLLRRTICCSDVAAKRFVSLKKESDKDISSLQSPVEKGLEVNQNLRGLDLFGLRDSALARRTVVSLSAIKIEKQLQTGKEMEEAWKRYSQITSKLKEMKMKASNEKFVKKREGLVWKPQVITRKKVHEEEEEEEEEEERREIYNKGRRFVMRGEAFAECGEEEM